MHGGDYPVQIWKYFMDATHAFLPPEDWPAPPAPAVSFGLDKKATGAPVPPDVLDLAWPLTSVPGGTAVFDCRRGPPPPAPAPPPAAAAPAPVAPAPNPAANPQP